MVICVKRADARVHTVSPQRTFEAKHHIYLRLRVPDTGGMHPPTCLSCMRVIARGVQHVVPLIFTRYTASTAKQYYERSFSSGRWYRTAQLILCIIAIHNAHLARRFYHRNGVQGKEQYSQRTTSGRGEWARVPDIFKQST